MVNINEQKCTKTYLKRLSTTIPPPFSKSFPTGLWSRESGVSSLSMEQLLETEAVAKSASISIASGLLKICCGGGRGRCRGGLPRFCRIGLGTCVTAVWHIMSEVGTRGSGRGWACALSAKLWHRETWVEGDGDLDPTVDRAPFTETVSLHRLKDPPNLVFPFCTVGLMNLCMVSMKFSLLVFFFTSLEEDFPHHDGILNIMNLKKVFSFKVSAVACMIQPGYKGQRKSNNYEFHQSDRNHQSLEEIMRLHARDGK